MRRALSAISFASLLTLAPACDSEDTVGDSFRDFEINVQMTTAGEGGSDDGTIVWEIVEAEVYEGPKLDDELLVYIDGDLIRNASGTATCQFDASPTQSPLELKNTSGTVLLTVYDNYVFAGVIDVGQVNGGNLDGLLFEFDGADIYDGEAEDDIKLMSTDANLELQNDERKLLMAALIVGVCGSPGLTGYSQ